MTGPLCAIRAQHSPSLSGSSHLNTSSHDRPDSPTNPPQPPAPPASESDLNECLVRVAKFDTDAFAALYVTMLPRARAVIIRTLRDPAQAEEVTQEVLLEVWLKAATFDPRRGGASAWILSIATRRAIDRVRAVEAERAREDKIASTVPSEPNDDVLDRVLQQLAAEQVTAALGQLTENQRQAVVLAFYRGNSYAAIAEILRIPVGTAKTRIRDALIHLRRILSQSP
jgi:RNA polymerase sigma-70 factor, ECF subfamily